MLRLSKDGLAALGPLQLCPMPRKAGESTSLHILFIDGWVLQAWEEGMLLGWEVAILPPHRTFSSCVGEGSLSMELTMGQGQDSCPWE